MNNSYFQLYLFYLSGMMCLISGIHLFSEESKIKSEDDYIPPALEDHCYIKSPVKRKYTRQPKPPV